MLPSFILIFNAVLLIAVIAIAIRTVRFAQQHNYLLGDSERQGFYRHKVLVGLVTIVFIGLAAAILNVFFI